MLDAERPIFSASKIRIALSGFITTFFLLVPKAAIAIYILGGFEALLILVLGWEIIVYADLAKSR